MRQNRIVIFIMCPVVIISFYFAREFNSMHNDFWSNVFLGIFGSALLTLISSIVSYSVEKKKCLENFLMSITKARNNFVRYKSSGDINSRINIVLRMSEFDYTLLNDSYRDMRFIFNNEKTRQNIYITIYKPIMETKKILNGIAQYLENYNNLTNKNETLIIQELEKLDKHIMNIYSYETTHDGGQFGKTKFVENRIVQMLDKEIDKFCDTILYPFKKSEETENAD